MKDSQGGGDKRKPCWLLLQGELGRQIYAEELSEKMHNVEKMRTA